MTDNTEQSGRFCTNCGSQVRPGSSFCTNCGASFSSEAGESGSSQQGPPLTELLGSLAGSFRTKLRGAGGSLGGLPRKGLEWFRDLPAIPKMVIAGVVLLVLFTLLSPLVLIAAAILLAVSITALIIRFSRRDSVGDSVRGWGAVAVASLVMVLVFGGISNVIYGGPSETVVYEPGSSEPSGQESGGSSADMGESAEDIASGLESQYAAEADRIIASATELGDRQIELYNFCLEFCGGESYAERVQNMQEMDQLLEEAEALDPPVGYEEGHSAFVSGVETVNEIAFRIATSQIGGAEIDSLSQDAVDYFDQSYAFLLQEVE